MTKYDVEHMPGRGGKVIVLQPFEDFTKKSGDDWLMTGIPKLMAEYLATSGNILPLFGLAAQYGDSAKNPAYTISGMYQHINNSLRIFVKMSEGGNLIKQWQVDLPYPENKQFFDHLSKTSLAIMEMVSPPYDRDAFERARTATESVSAYENYIRGFIAYSSFNPAQLEIAETYFDEAKRIDVYYVKPYQGMADMYGFMAIYNKQNQKPYSKYLELLQKEVNLEAKFMSRPPTPKRPKRYTIKPADVEIVLKNRFLLGNSSFVAGLEAAGRGQWLEAARRFDEALFYVPEDAILWKHLATAREKTGDKSAASKARARAKEINSCLE
jgi:tetratricopeptide (TPR) repeat protein